MTKRTPGIRKHPDSEVGHWEGVIRENGKVVWTCGHLHHNRHYSSPRGGKSAFDCASDALTAEPDLSRSTDISNNVIGSYADTF